MEHSNPFLRATSGCRAITVSQNPRDLSPSWRLGPMRSTTISSVPKASGPTGTAQRARKKPTSALVVLLLASAPRAGQPFLFPGKTSCPGAGGAAPTTDQVDGARLLRGSGSGSPLRGGALSGPDRQGAAGLGGVKPGGRAEVERVEEGAGGGAGDDGASKSRGREAGFGTRARSPAVGRRRKAWTNEAGSSALGSAARSKASTEVQEDSGPSQSSHAVEPQEEDRLSAAGVPTAGELLVKAREMFEEMFGEPADSREVSAGYAPGRVNLIGEHTDYNGGFVMPLALDRGTVLYGTGRLLPKIDAPEQGAEEACCRVMSESVMLSESGEMGLGDVTFRADASLTPGEPEWANYVKGVVKEYMGKIPEGKTLAFKAIVVSTVPIGGGVSSSASLCVATATFLDGVLKSAGVVPPSPKEKAHMCRMAEHRFMNMPCGIMDQFVTSMAEAGHAMLLDCRSEDPEDVPLMDPGLVIVVTNSNVKHKLAGSQYPVRVAQCEVARDELRKRHPEVELLRDASREQVEEIQGEVEQAVFRRARHVVSENSRTVAAAEALGKKDYGAAGRYMLESHASLREDYEVSCPEIDALVELAMEVEGVYGSRLTGGGFGGCTVTLADKDSVETLVGHLREGYQRSMGKDCSCFVTQPGFGARGLTGAAALSASKWPNT